jgi:Domain of unknown function (DUF5615)
MRFKADENPARGSGSAAVPGGHDAVTVGDEDLQGKPGFEIVAIVQRELRAFITLDLGFADIRSYPPSEFRGKALRLVLLFAILLAYYRVVRPRVQPRSGARYCDRARQRWERGSLLA